MPKLLATIAAQPIFKGMAPLYMQRLADNAMQVKFNAGDLIFRAGDPANRFYLIEHGQVALEVQRKDHARGSTVIQTVGEGQELGWEWLFPPHYEVFEARAVEPTQAIFFYGTRLRDECEQDHNFGYEMMKWMAGVLVRRLQAARHQMLEKPARAPTSPKPGKNGW